jgi:hypothetical protein
MPDEPTEATDETVPKWVHDTVRDHAEFLSNENEKLRNRPVAYLLGHLIAGGVEKIADAVLSVWAEREKWKGGKR